MLLSFPVAHGIYGFLNQARSDWSGPVPFPGWTRWFPLSLLLPESRHYSAVFVLDHWTPHGDGGGFSPSKPEVESSGRPQTCPSLLSRPQPLAPLPVPTRLQVLASLPVRARLVPPGSGSPEGVGTAPTRGGACQASSLFSITLSASACLGEESRVYPMPAAPPETPSNAVQTCAQNSPCLLYTSPSPRD